jgi:hypothetical protein
MNDRASKGHYVARVRLDPADAAPIKWPAGKLPELLVCYRPMSDFDKAELIARHVRGVSGVTTPDGSDLEITRAAALNLPRALFDALVTTIVGHLADPPRADVAYLTAAGLAEMTGQPAAHSPHPERPC